MASLRDVAKASNIIGADFLSSSDKKTLDDLIYEYFDPRSKCDIMNSLHNNKYNLHFKSINNSDEFEEFFQTEGN